MWHQALLCYSSDCATWQLARRIPFCGQDACDPTSLTKLGNMSAREAQTRLEAMASPQQKSSGSQRCEVAGTPVMG